MNQFAPEVLDHYVQLWFSNYDVGSIQASKTTAKHTVDQRELCGPEEEITSMDQMDAAVQVVRGLTQLQYNYLQKSFTFINFYSACLSLSLFSQMATSGFLKITLDYFVEGP